MKAAALSRAASTPAPRPASSRPPSRATPRRPMSSSLRSASTPPADASSSPARLLVTVVFDGVVPGETGIGSTGRSVRLRRRPLPASPSDSSPASPPAPRASTPSPGRTSSPPPRPSPEPPPTSPPPLSCSTPPRCASRGWVSPSPSTSSPAPTASSPGPPSSSSPRAQTPPTPRTPSTSSPSPPAGCAWPSASPPAAARRSPPSLSPPSSLPAASRRTPTTSPASSRPGTPGSGADSSAAPGVDYPFTLASLAPGAAKLEVDLLGGSDTTDPQDHHVRVSIGGTEVAQAHWDGMTPFSVEADVPDGVLVEGPNTLRLDSDGQNSSAVYLDRFSLDYPHALAAEAGVLEGKTLADGAVQASGFSPGSVLLDLSGRRTRWLGRTRGTGSLAFAAEAGHDYLAVSPAAILRPEIRPVTPSSLLDAANQADWILIAPEALLPAAEPLVLHRAGPGPRRSGRLPRARLRRLRLRRSLPRRRPRIPRLRLPPLDFSRPSLRPPPR